MSPTIRELLLSGRVLRDGAEAARARRRLRLLAGLDRPVTLRELRETIDVASALWTADDPVRALDARRDRVDALLPALLAADAARARNLGDLAVAERLESIWRLARLLAPRPEPLAELLDVGAYKGGLIDSIRKPGGEPPDYLAIDLDPANASGALSVDRMDATRLDLPTHSVSQVYLLDILEHLHGERQVFDAIAEAVRVAIDHVYVECPNFGDDAYLAARGLKWCWSDWTGHTMPATLALFREAADRLDLGDVADVDLGETVYDSTHPQMVRLDAPRDLTIATPEIERWRPAETVRFDRAVHHRVFLRVAKHPDVVPLWVSPTRRTQMRPESSRLVPTDDGRMSALLTAKLGRDRPVDAEELAAANGAIGRILEGDAPDEVLQGCAATADVLDGMLDLLSLAMRGDGKPELAADLGALRRGLRP